MTDLTNTNVKMNFQMAVFSFPDTYDLDPITKVRRERRLNLGPDMTSEQIQVDQKYYTVLNTQSQLKGDLAVAYWYDDAAVVHVESQIVRIKRVNTSTQLELANIVRGRISEISFQRLYPGADMPEGNPVPSMTWNNLVMLQNKRELNYLNHKYVAAIELNFNEKYKGLQENSQARMLTTLDKYASEYFPGQVETILIDTPLAKTENVLLVYFNFYLELNNYISMVKSLDVANYLEGGFGNITLCNLASKQQLESPQSMVKANR